MRSILSFALAVAILATPASAASKDGRRKIGLTLTDISQRYNPIQKPALVLTEPGALALLKYYGVGAGICAVGTLIGSGLVKGDEELTSQEALSIVANCLVPKLGGAVVALLFANHPEWSQHPGPVTDRAYVDLAIIGAEPCFGLPCVRQANEMVRPDRLRGGRNASVQPPDQSGRSGLSAHRGVPLPAPRSTGR